MHTLKKLQQQIQAKKEEMINIGLTKGLAHPDTVKVSQELDTLLNKYMEVKGQ